MPGFRTGTVTSILVARPGLQRVEVDHVELGSRRAYVLTELIGDVAVGDQVVVNTTAVDLGLGTGGWDVVHWNLSRESWTQPGPGHIMKLRYTSLQSDTGCVEETEGWASRPLEGAAVVACDLHSQVACVAAAATQAAPDTSVLYVMTDGGALPIALSDLVHEAKLAGLIHTTVTAGQAFGGDLEAVSVHSGLDAAASAGDGVSLVIAGIGPGAVGTGTATGSTAMEVARIIDATAALGGTPVVAVRYSDADRRDRHRGVSSHTLLALKMARSPAVVAVPSGSSWPEEALAVLEERGHLLVEVEVPDVPALLEKAGLLVTSMGRGPDEDPGFYLWAGAAGIAAVERPWLRD